MKLNTYERSGKPESMTLQASPLVVWLDRQHELRIEKGDRLDEVCDAIEHHWALPIAQARQLVAFWFAIGERRARKVGGPWVRKELAVMPSRRYLT